MKNDKEFRYTEKLLYNYKKIDNQISQLEMKIESIKNDIVGCGFISYDDIRVSPTNGFNSIVENEVMRRVHDIELLENKIVSLKMLKNRLDMAIDSLNSEQKSLFESRYINGDSWWKALNDMNISKDTYYRIRYSVVENIANELNPDKKIEEVYS